MTDQLKTLSCGVILVNEKREILMFHATNQKHWDIPKGTKNPGETEIETALRELREETGLILEESQLEDISYHEYNNYKDLWLFIAKMPHVSLLTLKCSSTYLLKGKRVPEADDYAMVPYKDIPDYACGSLVRVFDSSLKQEIEIFHRKHFS